MDPRLPPTALPRRSLLTETLLVLGVSLGASAVWSVLSITRKLTAPGGLAAQTTSMNTSAAPDQPWIDLAYQLVGIALALVPVVLALHLLGRDVARPWRLLGLDRTRPVRDLVQGTMLAAVIGIPGLGLYLLARELGVNTTVAPANLPSVWWAVPVLVLAAVQNSVVEEVIAVGYLFTRWGQAGWSTWTIILTSAVLRGTYHLYQGFGGFVGNVAMGIILGWFYTRTRRVMPLVVAHTLLDVVAFVGYAALAGRVGWL
ncbi:type II CAAX endopeptidase family protein [uncultured Serinicoccus sp.]|uniref:CPBP family intramembrane glutamic endopeptidase n=1 Tax=uncultured Serinicoccus sp. TaxID=735514 RepID=UPI0026136063|nr:type II CAAX endopeptidase family protein [uncultured Serinicoccus sp.]